MICTNACSLLFLSPLVSIQNKKVRLVQRFSDLSSSAEWSLKLALMFLLAPAMPTHMFGTFTYCLHSHRACRFHDKPGPRPSAQTCRMCIPSSEVSPPVREIIFTQSPAARSLLLNEKNSLFISTLNKFINILQNSPSHFPFLSPFKTLRKNLKTTLILSLTKDSAQFCW